MLHAPRRTTLLADIAYRSHEIEVVESRLGVLRVLLTKVEAFLVSRPEDSKREDDILYQCNIIRRYTTEWPGETRFRFSHAVWSSDWMVLVSIWT
jgi:hypothetical protein